MCFLTSNDNLFNTQFANPTTILDLGSYTIKAGFMSDYRPVCETHSVIGYPKQKYMTQDSRPYFIGSQVFHNKKIGKIESPIWDGKIQNFDIFERILHYVFYNELKIIPHEHKCTITLPLLYTPKMKNQLLESMFEVFNVPAIYLMEQPLAALYAHGKLTGTVVLIGHEFTVSVPIYQGYCIEKAVMIANMGGKNITDYLHGLLKKRGYLLKSKKEKRLIEQWKEECSYIALYPSKEKTAYQINEQLHRNQLLPDGEQITLKTERFKAPELLFNPQIAGLSDKSLPNIIHISIQNCDRDLRKELSSNIILAGGSSVYPGLIERLYKHLNESSSNNLKYQIHNSEDRKYSVWRGTSVFSSINVFKDFLIKRSDWLKGKIIF